MRRGIDELLALGCRRRSGERAGHVRCVPQHRRRRALQPRRLGGPGWLCAAGRPAFPPVRGPRRARRQDRVVRLAGTARRRTRHGEALFPRLRRGRRHTVFTTSPAVLRRPGTGLVGGGVRGEGLRRPRVWPRLRYPGCRVPRAAPGVLRRRVGLAALRHVAARGLPPARPSLRLLGGRHGAVGLQRRGALRAAGPFPPLGAPAGGRGADDARGVAGQGPALRVSGQEGSQRQQSLCNAHVPCPTRAAGTRDAMPGMDVRRVQREPARRSRRLRLQGLQLRHLCRVPRSGHRARGVTLRAA
mmetsp:Transcript_15508/g.42827  ORF Transcript_15508/g.42827 Transcript_15508/m.42827 type:complete len:301 (+) Transcript_15508:521-1423(+)